MSPTIRDKLKKLGFTHMKRGRQTHLLMLSTGEILEFNTTQKMTYYLIAYVKVLRAIGFTTANEVRL